MNQNLVNPPIESRFEVQFPLPDVTYIGNGLYQLNQDYVYVWSKNGVLSMIRVPAGFRFDGASIPWFLWTALKTHPAGELLASSVIHDFLDHKDGNIDGYFFYWGESEGEWKPVVSARPWTYKERDLLFNKMNIESGVRPKVLPWYYRAVRLWAILGLRK